MHLGYQRLFLLLITLTLAPAAVTRAGDLPGKAGDPLRAAQHPAGLSPRQAVEPPYGDRNRHFNRLWLHRFDPAHVPQSGAPAGDRLLPLWTHQVWPSQNTRHHRLDMSLQLNLPASLHGQDPRRMDYQPGLALHYRFH